MRKKFSRLISTLLTLTIIASCLPVGIASAYGEPITAVTPKRDAALAKGKVFQVCINGDDVVGQTLTSKYEYYALNRSGSDFTTGPAQSGSTFRWLSSATRVGGYAPIAGATAATYVLTQADLGKYIRFEVTPRNVNGGVGEVTLSEPVGPVLAAADFGKINNMFAKDKTLPENDTVIAAATAERFGASTYFVCDTTLDNKSKTVIAGSNFASVGGIKKELAGMTPVLTGDKVMVNEAFVRTILQSDYNFAGAQTVDLATVAAAMGKTLWIADGKTDATEYEEAGNYRTTPMAKGLTILSDADLGIDTIRDRDILNEAANRLYQLRATDEQMQWFRDAKYGMFVHWDPSSLAKKEISWSRAGMRRGESSPNVSAYGGNADPQYDSLYMDFNPINFNADELIATAKANGLKYIVFIAKHHGAFSNFQTDYRTDFSIGNTAYKNGQGDIMKEVADAAHKEGLKLGFYYSPRDWSNPYYSEAEHYRYMEHYIGQLTELCSNYGGLDILWFDSIGKANPGGYVDPQSAWDPRTVLRRIKQMQPNIVINDRYISELADYGPQFSPADVHGDWTTPEIRLDDFDDTRPWESCMCSESGGHEWSDGTNETVISQTSALQYLINNTCNDGNLLLNFGPIASGEMRQPLKDLYAGVGTWLHTYGPAIYNTRGGPYKNTNSWGGSTYRVEADGTATMYLHVSPLIMGCSPTTGTLTIPKAPDGRIYQVANAKLLKNNAAVTMTQDAANYSITLPAGESWDAVDTVIVVKEAMTDAVAAAIAAAEALLANPDPLMAGRAAHLRTLVEAARTQQTGAALTALQTATARYEDCTALATKINKLNAAISTTEVGTGFWQCPVAQYNTAVALAVDATNTLQNEASTAENLRISAEGITDTIAMLENISHKAKITIAPSDKVLLTAGEAITITASDPQAEIRYTLDGSAVTATSPRYTGAIAAPAGLMTIKAAPYMADKKVGTEVSQQYIGGAVTNVAQGGTVTESSVYDNNATYNGAKAFDGNMATRWATPNGTPTAWLQVDMGAEKTFNSMLLKEYSDDNLSRISAMDLQYSTNGTTWQTIVGDQPGGLMKLWSFAPVTARYFRLNIKVCQSVTIYEVQLYNAAAATVPTQGNIALEARTTKFTPAQVIDLGVSGTVNGAAVTSANVTYTVTPVGAATVSGNKLTVASDFVGSSFALQASKDGVSSNTLQFTLGSGSAEKNLVVPATVATTSNVYSAAPTHAATNITDGNGGSRWAGVTNAGGDNWVELNGLDGNTFHQVVIDEYNEPTPAGMQANNTTFTKLEIQKKTAAGAWETVATKAGAGTGGVTYEMKNSHVWQTDKWVANEPGATTPVTFAWSDDSVKNCGWKGTDNSYAHTQHTLTFPAVDGNAVRILLPGDQGPSIYEIRVMGSTQVASENIVKAGTTTATASDYYNNAANYAPGLTVDADMTTRWATLPLTTGDHWLQLDALQGNTYHTVVVKEYSEPDRLNPASTGHTELTKLQVQKSTGVDTWETIADKQVLTEGVTYTMVPSHTWKDTWTREGGTFKDGTTVIFNWDDHGWKNTTDSQYAQVVHTITFPAASGDSVRLVMAGTEEPTIFEVEVMGGTTGAVVIKPTSIELAQKNLIMAANATAQLDAAVRPTLANNQELTYQSANTAVATVSASGLVTAVGTGATTITVTSVGNPAVTATCYVTVSAGAATAHSIIVTPVAGGTLVPAKSTEIAGAFVGVTVTPESGKSLQSVSLNGTPLNVAVGSTAFRFTMPDADATLLASFDTAPVITYTLQQLTEAIAAAQTLKDSVATSTNGADVAASQKWATAANIATFANAITTANGVATTPGVAEGAITAAYINLAAAKTTFDGQCRMGTRALIVVSTPNAELGAVALQKPDGTPIADASTIVKNDLVKLVATPTAGKRFVKWVKKSGGGTPSMDTFAFDGAQAEYTANPLILRADVAVALEAEFAAMEVVATDAPKLQMLEAVTNGTNPMRAANKIVSLIGEDGTEGFQSGASATRVANYNAYLLTGETALLLKPRFDAAKYTVTINGTAATTNTQTAAIAVADKQVVTIAVTSIATPTITTTYKITAHVAAKNPKIQVELKEDMTDPAKVTGTVMVSDADFTAAQVQLQITGAAGFTGFTNAAGTALVDGTQAAGFTLNPELAALLTVSAVTYDATNKIFSVAVDTNGSTSIPVIEGKSLVLGTLYLSKAANTKLSDASAGMKPTAAANGANTLLDRNVRGVLDDGKNAVATSLVYTTAVLREDVKLYSVLRGAPGMNLARITFNVYPVVGGVENATPVNAAPIALTSAGVLDYTVPAGTYVVKMYADGYLTHVSGQIVATALENYVDSCTLTAGNLNADTVIDTADRTLLLTVYNQAAANGKSGSVAADFDDDGHVNAIDLGRLLLNYTK